jgi:Tol biopolymer transport system component
VAAGAAGVLWLWPPPAPVFDQVTFQRGRIGGARFTSDGRSILYSQAQQSASLGVWRFNLGESQASLPLDFPAGSDLLAVRGGEVALGLSRQFWVGERFVGRLALAPVGGGPPRGRPEEVDDADWDPVTGQLAIARANRDRTGQIEFPPGNVVHKAGGSMRFVRVAPDGQRIAFLADETGRGIGGTVTIVDLKGAATTLTRHWNAVRGLAWSPSGSEIWFGAGDSRSSRKLHAVSLGGSERLVYEAPGSLTVWDIAADGSVLLSTDEERRGVYGRAPGEADEREISAFDNAGVADISDDGKWIVGSDRSGVYVRGTDGSPPMTLLKEGFADDLSANGDLILATVDDQRSLVVVPRAPGEQRPIEKHGIVGYRGARWFPDGRRVLFVGVEQDQPARSYVQDLAGGAPTPITPASVRAQVVSPAGTHVAAVMDDKPITLWPATGGGPPVEVKGSEAGDRPVGWSDDGRSLWVFRRGEIPSLVFKIEIATGKRDLVRKLLPTDAAGVYSIIEFTTTPSGHAYAYGFTRVLSQLYVAKGLR